MVFLCVSVPLCVTKKIKNFHRDSQRMDRFHRDFKFLYGRLYFFLNKVLICGELNLLN